MTVVFTTGMQQSALARQDFRCASCGTPVWGLGHSAREFHEFGEQAEAHHLIPHKKRGPNIVANCVIVCRSCHINAHQGGLWRDVSIYDDLKMPMSEKIATVAKEYPYYGGTPQMS